MLHFLLKMSCVLTKKDEKRKYLIKWEYGKWNFTIHTYSNNKTAIVQKYMWL